MHQRKKENIIDCIEYSLKMSVILDIVGNVATITFNNPKRGMLKLSKQCDIRIQLNLNFVVHYIGNAFSGDMLGLMLGYLDQIEGDQRIRVLVLTGKGEL